MKKNIRVRQLFRVLKLVDRWPFQPDAQADIWQKCMNIIYLL